MDTINDEKINIIKQIPQVPEPLKIIDDILKEQRDFAESFISYIEQNDELKKQIISLSNCKYFTASPTITTIKAAILTHGIMKLKNIIMLLSLKKVMDLNDNGFENLWRHSIKCAVACEIIANQFSIINPQDAFALGLLHDIGKVIIYKNNIDKFFDFNYKVNNQDEDIISLENEFFKTNHTTDGTTILKKWGMPRILIDCIKYHHTPSLSTIPSASGTIYIADRIARSEKQDPMIENSIMNRLGLLIPDLKNFKMNVEVKANFIFEALGI